MQFEEFDIKVRQAADHHHPAYDQDAWLKMEKLLDKHMPQEKENKRRFIFFLLFFLLLGGGAWLVISKRWKKQSTLGETHHVAPVNKNTAPSNNDQQNIVSIKPVENPENINPTSPFADEKILNETSTGPAENKVGNVPRKNDQHILFVQNQNIKDKPAISKNKKDDIRVLLKSDVPVNDVNDKNANAIAANNDIKPTTNTLPSSEIQKPASVVPEKKEVAKKEEPVKATEPDLAKNDPKKEKQKSKTKKPNTFFFSLSAGPDISFVGSSKPGTTKVIAGGGIGFTLRDRITFRTGFYTGRKVYTASPYDYNPPANFWTYYPYLQKVNADCKVYEIPVSVSYNFGKKKNHSWYGGAEISSLLMKKETYNYYYKYTPTSPVYSKKYSIKNQNEHYFSVLTLSAGYQRTIGKHISIAAEPYFKLPLTGIGLGKVKLNSGGVMFTVAVNPFSFKKSPAKKSP